MLLQESDQRVRVDVVRGLENRIKVRRRGEERREEERRQIEKG